jgi:uncharacterized membrane protein
VDLYSWLLALHVLSAAALVTAMTLFTAMVVASRTTDVPSAAARFFGLARVGNVVVGVGLMGTLIFGIWLAIQVDGYSVWDPWILVALVLWALAAEAGRRSGVIYTEAGNRAVARVREGNDEPDPEIRALLGSNRALGFHVASVTAVVLILVDMIYKPWA